METPWRFLMCACTRGISSCRILWKKQRMSLLNRCNKAMKQIRSVIFIQTEAGYPVLSGLALSGAWCSVPRQGKHWFLIRWYEDHGRETEISGNTSSEASFEGSVLNVIFHAMSLRWYWYSYKLRIQGNAATHINGNIKQSNLNCIETYLKPS